MEELTEEEKKKQNQFDEEMDYQAEMAHERDMENDS